MGPPGQGHPSPGRASLLLGPQKVGHLLLLPASLVFNAKNCKNREFTEAAMPRTFKMDLEPPRAGLWPIPAAASCEHLEGPESGQLNLAQRLQGGSKVVRLVLRTFPFGPNILLFDSCLLRPLPSHHSDLLCLLLPWDPDRACRTCIPQLQFPDLPKKLFHLELSTAGLYQGAQAIYTPHQKGRDR